MHSQEGIAARIPQCLLSGQHRKTRCSLDLIGLRPDQALMVYQKLGPRQSYTPLKNAEASSLAM